MKLALTSLILATAAFASAAEEPTGPIKARNDAAKPKFVFSLAPRSMQANPTLDMTVITEVTPEGKSRKPATPSEPLYYEAAPGGFRQMGSASANENEPAQEMMESIMKRGLSRNGYLPHDGANPPTLAVIYHWGSFARADTNDPEMVNTTPEVMYRELIERATLTGGSKFAGELAKVMEQRFELMNAQPPTREGPDGSPIISQQVIGHVPGSMMDPVEHFLSRDKRTRFLAEQADTNLYYVIASAFDYAALAKGQKILLWRTKMTVDAGGVSMTQTFPTLVASAAEYFGREMDGPATLVQSVREGRIELGEATVVGEEPAKPAQPATAPGEKK